VIENYSDADAIDREIDAVRNASLSQRDEVWRLSNSVEWFIKSLEEVGFALDDMGVVSVPEVLHKDFNDGRPVDLMAITKVAAQVGGLVLREWCIMRIRDLQREAGGFVDHCLQDVESEDVLLDASSDARRTLTTLQLAVLDFQAKVERDIDGYVVIDPGIAEVYRGLPTELISVRKRRGRWAAKLTTAGRLVVKYAAPQLTTAEFQRTLFPKNA